MKPSFFSPWCRLLPLVFLAGCDRNTYVAPPPPDVTVQYPVQQDVTVFQSFPGTIQAVDQVDIRARVSGFLKEVHFRDGQTVQEGDLLFTIEQDMYASALQAAEAALAQARAADQLAGAAYERKRQAAETGAVSELDLLTAEAEKNSAEAAVQAAEATVAAAQLDLSYTEVAAPVTGRIGRRLVSIGNLVGGAEATRLATVVVQHPLHVYFNIDERTALRLFELGSKQDAPGARTEELFLELADGSRFEHAARPEYVDPTFDVATGTLAVRAIVDNPDGRIAPGMFTRVLVPVQVEDAVLVPEIAIQRDLQGPFLLVVDDEDMVSAAHVELGPQVLRDRVVREGVGPDDRIIVQGLQRARPGIKVNAGEAVPGPEPAAAAADTPAADP